MNSTIPHLCAHCAASLPALGSVFLASLLGSPHCAVMCGGFVALYSGERASRAAHALYSLGRLVSYLGLGMLAGVFGKAITHAGERYGVPQLAGILVGAVLISWGINGLRPRGRAPQFVSVIGSASHGILMRLLPRIVRANVIALKPLAIGLVTALLPCGFLYAFVTVAAGTGSAAGGAAVMLFFWAGTVPILVSIGSVLQRSLAARFPQLPRLAALCILLAGVFSLAAHLSMTTGHCAH